MTLTVGTCHARPGELTKGELSFGELHDGTPASVPIIMLSGKQAGPVLWLSAALHGTEVIGIEVIRRLLYEALDPSQIAGTLVAAPIANPLAFRAARYTSPEDGGNPHHGMPGDPAGSISQRLTHALVTQGLDQADAVIDLHTNPAPYLPFSALSRVPGAPRDAYERSLALAQAFGLTTVERPVSRQWGRHMAEYVQGQGKPCIAVHFVGYHRFDEAQIQAGVEGCRNALIHLGIIQGEPRPLTGVRVLSAPVFRDDRCDLRVNRGGLLHAQVEPGDRVARDTPLAIIYNGWGEVVEVVRSPLDGVFLGLRADPNQSVSSGQIAVAIGLLRPPD